MHQTKIVKVNMPIDVVVAPLVESLNASPDIVTINSCEADESDRAYVDFTYGNSASELLALLENLAQKLATLKTCCGYSIGLEWHGDNPQPRGHLAVSKSLIADVAAVVREAVSSDRTNQSVCDIQRTVPHH
jgi:hypothetical protein